MSCSTGLRVLKGALSLWWHASVSLASRTRCAPLEGGGEVAENAAMVNRLLTALVACALVVASAPLSERRGAAAGSSVASAGVPVFLPRPLDFAPFMPALEALPAARLAELDALVSTADIATLRARLAGGEVEARELVLAYLSRIRRFDGALAAVIELNPDALREAVRLDAQRAAGSGTGPLHGIPILLKDNIATGDRQRTTVGALALADHRAPRDAEVVARLREAGALILGKTNLSEWAYFMSSAAPSGFSALGGQTSNPHGADLARCSAPARARPWPPLPDSPPRPSAPRPPARSSRRRPPTAWRACAPRSGW